MDFPRLKMAVDESGNYFDFAAFVHEVTEFKEQHGSGLLQYVSADDATVLANSDDPQWLLFGVTARIRGTDNQLSRFLAAHFLTLPNLFLLVPFEFVDGELIVNDNDWCSLSTNHGYFEIEYRIECLYYPQELYAPLSRWLSSPVMKVMGIMSRLAEDD